MSLTTGRGPLSPSRGGTFSAPVPDGVVYVEPHDRRVRGFIAGRCVVDSETVLLVHRPGRPPSYAFPPGAVTGAPTDPEDAAPGHVRIAWEAIDEWFEEEEPIRGHARNPYHRVDCIATTRRLRVEVAGVVLVDTETTTGVYETALAPRLYVDRSLVHMDLLVPSETTTWCSYKGTASYWSAVVGGTTVADVAWSYDDPLPESLRLRELLSFDATRVDLRADLPARGAG